MEEGNDAHLVDSHLDKNNNKRLRLNQQIGSSVELENTSERLPSSTDDDSPSIPIALLSPVPASSNSDKDVLARTASVEIPPPPATAAIVDKKKKSSSASSAKKRRLTEEKPVNDSAADYDDASPAPKKSKSIPKKANMDSAKIFDAVPSSNSAVAADRHSSSLNSTPAFIKGSMKQYQIEGLNWLIGHHKNGTNGILADDMGLGKTLQVISMLGYLKNEQKINGPFLVVTPLVTLSNWEAEFKRWCSSLRVTVFHGSQYERMKQFSDMKKQQNKWDVCLTTQNMMRDEHLKLKTIEWNYLVIDEAHSIKSIATKLSDAVRSLKADHRLLVTGTPVNNNRKELWALANFIEPFKFDKMDVFTSNDSDDEFLRALLKPHLLRRLKSDYATDLLEKEIEIVIIERTDYHKQVAVKQFAAAGKGKSLKKVTADLEIQKIIFERQLASHPNLVDAVYRRSMSMVQIVKSSGKMKYLDALLPQLKADDSNVLIFSQFMQMLDILQFYCRQKGYPCCRLDGSVIGKDRAKQISRFKRSIHLKFKIFLMTTKAGGEGINLTEANSVVLYDRVWNPQTDKQAMNRAHRIGQTKQVRVYRLVTEGTIEEDMMKKTQFKLDLADRLLLPKSNHGDEAEEEQTAFTAVDDGAVASTSTGIKRKRDDESLLMPAAKKKKIVKKRVSSSKGTKDDERSIIEALGYGKSKMFFKSDLEELTGHSKTKINDLASNLCKKVDPSNQRSKLPLKPTAAAADRIVDVAQRRSIVAHTTQPKLTTEKTKANAHLIRQKVVPAVESKSATPKIIVQVQQQTSNPDLLASIMTAQKKLLNEWDNFSSSRW